MSLAPEWGLGGPESKDRAYRRKAAVEPLVPKESEELVFQCSVCARVLEAKWMSILCGQVVCNLYCCDADTAPLAILLDIVEPVSEPVSATNPDRREVPALPS